MIPQDGGASLARILSELAGREGEALELALADSAQLFGLLGAQAQPRRRVAADRTELAITFERAQAELARLILRELLRLCEQGALARRCAYPRGDLAELLHEELDCAQSLACLPAELLARLRRLALRVPLDQDDSAQFQDCAVDLLALPHVLPLP